MGLSNARSRVCVCVCDHAMLFCVSSLRSSRSRGMIIMGCTSSSHHQEYSSVEHRSASTRGTTVGAAEYSDAEDFRVSSRCSSSSEPGRAILWLRNELRAIAAMWRSLTRDADQPPECTVAVLDTTTSRTQNLRNKKIVCWLDTMLKSSAETDAHASGHLHTPQLHDTESASDSGPCVGSSTHHPSVDLSDNSQTGPFPNREPAGAQPFVPHLDREVWQCPAHATTRFLHLHSLKRHRARPQWLSLELMVEHNRLVAVEGEG